MENQQYQLRKRDNLSIIKCYTLDLDWQILQNPQMDQKRFYEFLRFLRIKDKKIIQEYMNRNGCDAEIIFKQESAFKLKFNGIISLQEKTAPIKVEENIHFQHNKQKKKIRKIKYLRKNKLSDNCSFYDVQIKIENNQDKEEETIQESVKDHIIQQLAKKYHIDMQQFNILIRSVSDDYRDLMKYLNGNTDILWSPFEDEILQKYSDDQIEYKSLIRYKGQSSVLKRLQFLQ